MSFSSDMKAWSIKAGESMIFMRRTFFFELSRDIIERTPVDTGRAKSNWQASLGDFVRGTVGIKDPLPKVAAITKLAKGDETLCLVNNLHYIMALEEGHSQRQAPYGMVGLAVGNAEAALAKAAK
jgi:hypothetical protein